MPSKIQSTDYPYFPFRIASSAENRKRIVSPYTNGRGYLNDSAELLLKLCNGSLSFGEITDELSKIYSLPGEKIIGPAGKFICRLTSDGLIWVRDQKMSWYDVPPPQTVFWEITSECNLKCLHCVVSADKKLDGELCTQSCCNFIDELKAFGIRDLVLSGGEPLIRDDFYHIARYARSRNIAVQLATNGVLVTGKVAKELKKLDISVQVSLDGSNAEIYGRFRGCKKAFPKVIRGIENLVNEGVDLTIGTVFSNHNLDDIPDMLKLVERHGVKIFRLIPFIPSGRGKINRDLEPGSSKVKEITRYLYEMRGKVPFTILPLEFENVFSEPLCKQIDPLKPSECGGAISYCTVTPEGDVLPCHYFYGVEADNIKERPFKWIWRQSRFLNYFRSLKIKDIEGYCRQCRWLADCRGSCKAANLSYGELFKSNRHCWLVEENANFES
jgi:radical SAM protein with 4Fe4S-binding SPASM domain